jgi:hypothetical protein
MVTQIEDEIICARVATIKLLTFYATRANIPYD